MTFFKSFNLTFLVALLTLSLSACTGGSKSQDGNHDHAQPAAQTVPSTSEADISREQAQKILAIYLQVKNALVQTNGKTASEAATKLVESLGEGEDELLNKIRFDASHIAETQDPGHQRDHFNSLSDNVFAMLKSTEANDAPIYRQYCPMAFEGKGGYWLAAEKEVNNPYFGDKMLHCGSVKEEL